MRVCCHCRAVREWSSHTSMMFWDRNGLTVSFLCRVLAAKGKAMASLSGYFEPGWDVDFAETLQSASPRNRCRREAGNGNARSGLLWLPKLATRQLQMGPDERVPFKQFGSRLLFHLLTQNHNFPAQFSGGVTANPKRFIRQISRSEEILLGFGPLKPKQSAELYPRHAKGVSLRSFQRRSCESNLSFRRKIYKQANVMIGAGKGSHLKSPDGANQRALKGSPIDADTD